MFKSIPVIAAGFVLAGAAASFAQCSDLSGQNATNVVAERAYDLQSPGKTYDVTVGGTVNTNHCGIPNPGFLPLNATVRLDLGAAEGKEAMITAESDCSETILFVATPDFREIATGNSAETLVAVHVPRSEIGNDQTILVFVGSANEGESCAGKVTFMTARG